MAAPVRRVNAWSAPPSKVPVAARDARALQLFAHAPRMPELERVKGIEPSS